MFIDADTHVDECDETWDYLAEKDKHLAPRTICFDRDQMPGWVGPLGAVRASMGAGYDSGYYRYWFIDGQLFVRRVRSDTRTGTSVLTREMRDVDLRISDMDGMGVDVQIIYPTLFLNEVSRRPEIEVALYRAYNRWIADRCAGHTDRFRWIAMIPFSSIPDALSEIKFASENGAVGIFKRGVEGPNRAASDPYFFPAYRAAADANLAVCIHQASAWQPTEATLNAVRPASGFPVLSAFATLLADKVPEAIAGLRVGFIEAGSSWVPYVLDMTGTGAAPDRLSGLRFFVTCEVSEDLPYLLETLGSSNFVIGTDYCHADRASVKDAHDQVMKREKVSPSDAALVTSGNARTLYGL